MVHYHVWFNLKPGVAESDGLRVVSDYLAQLSDLSESAGFQLLKNCGGPPRSTLPKYHALVEFVDSESLAKAMKNQASRGIHQGGHGQVIEVVCDFHVEIFAHIAPPPTSLVDS